jgi:hypothetical protein
MILCIFTLKDSWYLILSFRASTFLACSKKLVIFAVQYEGFCNIDFSDLAHRKMRDVDGAACGNEIWR